MGEDSLITIEAGPLTHKAQVMLLGDSTVGVFGAYPGYDPVITNDTFSLPGAIYERLDGKIDVRRNTTQKLYRTKWFTSTFDAMVALLRHSPIRSPMSRRVQLKVVASMLTILVEILDGRAPPPSVVPAWEGGLQVEWHRNGVDLEIEVSPSGNIEYFFASPDEEREGMAWEEIERLTKYARTVL